MSNLRLNEPPGGTVLERRWSSPQAQKPQDAKQDEPSSSQIDTSNKQTTSILKTQKTRFATTPIQREITRQTVYNI